MPGGALLGPRCRVGVRRGRVAGEQLEWSIERRGLGLRHRDDAFECIRVVTRVKSTEVVYLPF